MTPTQNVPLREDRLYRNHLLEGGFQLVNALYLIFQDSAVSHYPLDSIKRRAGGRRLYCCGFRTAVE